MPNINYHWVSLWLLSPRTPNFRPGYRAASTYIKSESVKQLRGDSHTGWESMFNQITQVIWNAPEEKESRKIINTAADRPAMGLCCVRDLSMVCAARLYHNFYVVMMIIRVRTKYS